MDDIVSQEGWLMALLYRRYNFTLTHTHTHTRLSDLDPEMLIIPGANLLSSTERKVCVCTLALVCVATCVLL